MVTARRQFTQLGYDATTVAGIAEEAEVSRAIVYDAVGDKETLLAAVADEAADELVDLLGERFSAPATTDKSLEDLILEEVTWFMNLVREDPSRVALIRMADHLGSPNARAGERARRGVEDHLTKLHLERYRVFGVERGEGARLLALLVLSIMEAAGFRAASEPGWPSEATTAAVAQFVLGGYLRVEGSGREVMETFDSAASDGSD